MADRLGHVFLRAAMGPVNYTASLIMARQVQSGLLELTRENILGAFRRGIALVAARSGASVADVERYLPVAAVARAASELGDAQQAAVAAWKRHAGHVGGLLEGVAELTIDGRPPDLAVCLSRLARKVSADREWARPLSALSDQASKWTSLLYECRDLVDGGEALAQAFQRRRIRRILLACFAAAAIGLGGVVGGWYQLRVGGARARVNDALAAGEICSWDEVAAADVSHLTDGQRSRVDQSIAECTGRREREHEEEVRKESEAKAAEARKQRAEQQVTRCGALASAVEAGKLTTSDETTAGAAAGLLRRVGWRRLKPEDLAPPDPALPCSDTPSAKALGEAFDHAVVASAGAWLTATDLSDRVRQLLVGHADELQLRHKSLFSLHADRAARRSLVSGDPEARGQAERLCAVAVDIGMRRGPNCLAIERTAK